MRVVSTIPYQKGCVRLLASAIVMIVLLQAQFVPISHASSGGAHFSIQPSFFKPYNVKPRGYFIYNSSPGIRLFDYIHVTNGGSMRGSIHLYAVDGITAPTSGTAFPSEKVPRHDVGAWITLSRSQVTLDPGQSQEVAFTLTIPSHVRPGQHGGGIVGAEVTRSHLVVSAQSNSVNIGIQTTLNLGVLVNLPGPTIERLDAGDIRCDEESYYQRLLIPLENTGTQLLYPSGNVQVFDEQGKLLQNLQLQLTTFLPQTSINYPVNIQHKALSPGRRYTAKLHLNYGHAHMLNYETSFLVPLSNKGPLTRIIQNLGSPVSTPGGNSFSLLTPWHYALAISLLFLILSTSIFWGQKIFKVLSRRRNKKRG